MYSWNPPIIYDIGIAPLHIICANILGFSPLGGFLYTSICMILRVPQIPTRYAYNNQADLRVEIAPKPYIYKSVDDHER